MKWTTSISTISTSRHSNCWSFISILRLLGCATILSDHVVWSQTTTTPGPAPGPAPAPTPLATTPVSRPTTTAGGSKTQLGGILATRYNVDEYARLSLDIKEIRKRMDSNTNSDGSATSALEIYVDGLNANDATTGLKRSLQKLALDLSVKEPKTPPFLYQLYGLTGASSTHLNVDIESQAKYVDPFIRQVFETQPKFASDAILATDVWMVAADFIYNAIYNCAATTAADDPDAVQLSPGGFDEFIALWIGVDQSMGSSVDGHSLYALAQFMGDQFEVYAVDNEERVPEAVINTRIVLLYQEAANALSTPGACTKDTPDLAPHLYNLGHQMVREMVKLLFQGLIFSLAQQEMGGIHVYSKALIPQLSQCRPSIYKKLSKELLQLFDNDPDVKSLDMERVEVILDALRDAMPCFGFYCEELGNVAGIAGFDLGCDTENRPFPMFAGYRASSDVTVVSRVDLDVHQLGILTQLQSSFFARYLYMYGANVHKAREGDLPLVFVSLRDIALSKERFNAEPLYDYYVEYHNEKDYADKAIMAALADDGAAAGSANTTAWKTVDQKATVVKAIAAYQILFMEAHAKLQSAVQQCMDADPQVGILARLDPVDEAAALIIGSMEGETLGGSPDLQDGQLLFNLANQHAFQFSVINNDKFANVNSEILDSLFAATAELDGLDCEDLQRTTTHIGRMITVGMIQGALQAAAKNEDIDEKTNPNAVTLAQGHVLTESVNPWIQHSDVATANFISENMLVKTPVQNMVKDGHEKVAKAFGKGLTYSIGLPCEYLGRTAEVDPCVGIPRNSGKGGGMSAATTSTRTSSYLVALLVSVVPALLLVVL